MSNLGVGSFLQGLGEGYDAQVKTNAIQAKDKREKDAHGIAMQNAQLELEEKKKDIAYKDDIAKSMQDLINESKPAEITDPNTGQVTQRPGMDPIELSQKAADTYKVVALKHGKVNLEMLKQSMEFGKMVDAEGAKQAIRYAMTNPSDQEGIRKIFNQKGDVKLGKDVEVVVEQGPLGQPNVVGYRVDAKGQRQQVFDSFRDIFMPSLSSDTFAKLMSDDRRTAIEQEGANYRSDSGNRTQLGVAGLNRESAKEIKRAEIENTNTRDGIKALQAQTTSNISSGLRGPQAQIQPERFMKFENEIGAIAEDLLKNNPAYKDRPSAALAYARGKVYHDNGISTEKLGLNK